MKLTGWRHTTSWTYLVMLIASASALLVSFVLSAETLQLARHPGAALACDVNSVISCSTVANSWQSEFIRVGALSFPNAFFGIAAESVFVTVAVMGLVRITFPRWFAVAAWAGNLLAVLYAVWLFTQSVFVIQALCPLCLGLLASSLLQFMAASHATFAVQEIPRKNKAVHMYYHLNIDLLVDLLIFALFTGIIFVKYGAALLG
ncbi:vitamin K epoxide reductase family protein [Alloscardovia omnicolens]|uniref:vitamin K epoxide reductase family protein n=1 Tax=Alloscardovia omnicolens TaxID=419015 RepID=UPI0006650C61|nr:vitamin K epoxide reductase family protein [Alloscardovia omnicolens]MDK6250745.1 vitamin K epoxide reductase family protein [Alloscardovia omnicolens]MDK6444667.1 vitamin K epoxide reductase family protein [Alloscardovia omnicolens]